MEALSAAQRDEVKTALGQADWVSVRDHVTQGALRQKDSIFRCAPTRP